MHSIELPAKLYFRIGEVARLLEVKPHVIRYWEKEFKSLRPKKSSAGQRIFNRNDVQRLAAIKHLLYVERFTIEGARKYLRDNGFEVGESELSPDAQRAERMKNALLSTKERLGLLLNKLSGGPIIANAANAVGVGGAVGNAVSAVGASNSAGPANSVGTIGKRPSVPGMSAVGPKD